MFQLSGLRLLTRSALLSAIVWAQAGFAQVAGIFTQPAGPVRATNATLNAMVLPRGGSPATVWFEWGIDNSYGNLTPPVTIGPGSKVVRVSQPITGLTPSASYHYRAAATN